MKYRVPSTTSMRLLESDIRHYATWSGDANPLHVDPEFGRRSYFGRNIAHGMLTVTRALGSDAGPAPGPIRTIDLEFRGAVPAGLDCRIVTTERADAVDLALESDNGTLFTARINGPDTPDAADASWLGAVKASGGAPRRDHPADRPVEAFTRPFDVAGRYETPEALPEGAGGWLAPIQVRVLGLCSYLVGMEVPGLRSLFTRLTLAFDGDLSDAPQLWYRIRRVRFDPGFRMLDTRLDVVRPDGRPVATADIRSYVRFSPVEVSPRQMTAWLSPAGQSLAGKVALVTGGSRGLGADITTGLAAAGCTVYATYHADRGAADSLTATLAAAGLGAELVQANAGDAAEADALIGRIRDRHGRLDVLVLNACAAPAAQAVGADPAAFDAFLTANLRLTTTPLTAALPLLDASRGTIAAISSSFVEDPPSGFAHYVALKQAVEAIARTTVREHPEIAGLVVRPPRLQTSWNDTPTGVLGTIPSALAAAHTVNALGDARAGQTAIVSDFPALAAAAIDDDGGEDEDAAPAPDLTVTVSSSFTADHVLPGLRFWFRELGLNARAEMAPYGQILQTLLTPPPATTARRALVVLLRLRDWLRELPEAQRESVDAVRAHVDRMVTDVVRAMQSHRAGAKSDTVLVLCPSELEVPDPHDATLAEAETALRDQLAGIAGLQVATAREFHELYDVRTSDIPDPLREHIAHVPYKDPYFHVLATIAMRVLHRRLARVRKVVAVDCDNTLWRGVVGEVGAEGIAFDAEHRALHATLSRLAAGGVLLALCSKNEEEDVWRVFETRADFGLTRDQIVTAAIDWRPKSENLRGLAARLNLGLDSFIFLDDNPVECADVRAACPEVLTLQWPTDPARARRLLRHTWELDAGAATAEDRRRTELYKEEFKRQALRSETLTFKEFLESLELSVVAAPLVPDDVPRAAQLTNRTNQFNFTTKRRDEAELAALAADPRYDIRTVRVTDRFGDYGLVGLVIADTQGDVTEADTFLLSCRVLGRGVEHHLAAELGRFALARGASRVVLRVIPTKRNTPARHFLEGITTETDRRVEDGVTVATLEADALAALTFEPAGDPEPIAEDGGAPKAAAAPVDAERLRSREDQVERTAYELSTLTELDAAIAGRPAATTSAVTAPSDVADAVYQAFAGALRMPVERIKEVDRLDALGCDSFRVVEITVNLTQRFPWLPGTLLFEHRAVSDIARHIAELSAAPAATPAMGTARGGPVATGGDIAVVGMHLRTAGAASPDDLWDLLSEGRVAVGPVDPARRFFLRPLDDTRPHFAGLLEDVDRFDAEFFGISPREAELMDPQLRLFLEVAWDALEDAGAAGDELDPETGVFAGVMYSDYAATANPIAQGRRHPYKSWESFSLANRLSQILSLRGPSLAIDTACSSSGTATHLAVRALQSGDCRVAIVGGVNLILDPDRFAQLGRLGILSATGRCLAFGAEADGTVLGEGVGVVVLRPLADAVARGDRIYGVVKGTGLSTGNGTVGFTAPNPTAQAEAIARALGVAGVDPRTIGYVETHGTGTGLGDPIEIRGLTLARANPAVLDPSVEGETRTTVGSIKPNVGHLEAGAGVISLIKVLLQLQRGELLPSVTSAEPNPQIPFEGSPFSIQRTRTPWTRPGIRIAGATVSVPRRAGVSSFGVGGANAHIVLEEPPASPSDATPAVARPILIPVSARNEEALRARLASLGRHVAAHPDLRLTDIAASAAIGRRHFAHRAGVVAPSTSALAALLEDAGTGTSTAGIVRGVAPRSGPAPTVAFLFTGQGAQHAGMGRALYDAEPAFRDALDACARVLDTLLERPLLPVMFAADGSDDAALLDQTGYTQPALFAFEYAMAALWQSWGVRPDVVIGHSVGEIGAMCVAGGMPLPDALRLIAARGRLMQALPEGGVMTSVMADEARVRRAIEGFEDRVALAAINSPSQVVVSGEREAVERVTAGLREDGIRTRALVVSHAFHSPLMGPMVDEYARVLAGIRVTPPRVPIVSAVTGALAGPDIARPEYWLRNVTDPVRFADGARALAATGASVFLEVGPQPTLIGLGRQSIEDADRPAWVASAKRTGDPLRTLADAQAQLYVRGVALDWRALSSGQRISLPSYPFTHRSFWIDVEAVPPAAHTGAARPAAPRPAPAAYDTAWRQVAPPAEAPAADSRWLVISNTGTEGRALVETLRARGADVRADAWQASPDAWASLLSADDHAHPVRIVALADVDAPADPAHGARTLVAQLTDLLRGAGASPGTRVWIVTRGAAATHATDVVGPCGATAAAVWGFGRTAALELPDHWGGLIDLPWDGAGGTLDPASAEAVAREILAATSDTGEDQVALRDGGRYVPRLVPRALTPGQPPRLDADGTYLVTGGLGAVGRRLATWLVARGARHLTLTGRRGWDTPGAAEIAASLRAAGAADVRVEAADAGSAIDVDAVLERIADTGHALRGIVHAAGVDDETPLTALSGEAIARVLTPKADGAWLLHDRTQAADLDLFLCVSSISALLGAAHRAHYAAANGFLDGLVRHRRDQGAAATSIEWGPWLGGGLAGDATLAAFERIGNHGLEPDAAVALLDRLVADGAAVTAVAAIDWPRFAPVYEARRPKPILRDVAGRDGTSSSADTAAPWIPELTARPPAERHAWLVARLRAEAAQILGLPSDAELALDQPLYASGMDSLLAADFARRVQSGLGLRRAASVLDTPLLEPLATALLEEIDTATLPVATLVETGAAVSAAGDFAAGLRKDAVASIVRAELAATLALGDPQAVPSDLTFTEMGMDSLMAAELAGRLRSRFGIEHSGLVFDFPTVGRLTDRLLELARPSAAATAHAVATASTTTGAKGIDSHERGGVAAPPAPIDAPGVSLYRPSHDAALFAFHREAWPRRRSDWVEDRWRWMFVGSARRLGRDPQVWLYRDRDRIVAHNGAMPVTLKIGDGEAPTAWLVDTMVLEAYRTQAVGSRLMVAAQDDLPFAISLGQTDQMRAIQVRLGWHDVGRLETAQLLLRPERVLKGKLPAPAATAAGWGLRASQAVRDVLRTRHGGTLTAIERFDTRHDALWDTACADVACAVRRDASYLNWKYVDQPGQTFLRYDYHRDGALAGSVILVMREPDDAYRYRRGLIVDLVAPVGNEEVLAGLLEAAVERLAQLGADAAICLHLCPPLTAALKRAGFHLRDQGRHLLVLPGDQPESRRRLLLDPSGWLVTQGDSDIDRPW